MIHAYAAPAPSKPLQPFTYTPVPSPDKVEIAIECCGLCHTDLHMIDNDWNLATFPLVPGHEIVGKVIGKGSNVQGFEIGDRVGVGWQSGACFTCSCCLHSEEQICPSKKRTCVDPYGGFADKIFVDYRFVYPIPKELPSTAAAPLLCAGVTVYSPFKHDEIQAPMKVGVIGIGGLGHLALQFAKAFGCEVTALSSSMEKEAEARKFGASAFIHLGNPATLKKAANTFDFILSTSTVDLDWNTIVLLLRSHGKLCFVGYPPNNIQVSVRALTGANRMICGSTTGNRADMNEMLEFAARHKILPQIETFPMSQINEAISRLRSNQARYRIVLTNT